MCYPTIPEHTLMLDNGSGMAGFKELESATGMRTYFCTPIRRGSVGENDYGLLWQYFSKKNQLP